MRPPIGSAKSKPAKVPAPRKHPYPPNSFATWYAKFPRKKARHEAERAFRKIEAADDIPFAVLLAGIEAFWAENPDVAYWPHPATWLNQRRWTDEPTKASRPNDAGAEDRIDFGGGVRWRETTVRGQVAKWRSDPTSWPESTLGPPPDRPGCRVPEHLLRMAA